MDFSAEVCPAATHLGASSDPDKGRAMVEATDINKNNDIRVDVNGVSTKILKNGLYDLDSNQSTIRVFKGKAEVVVNDKKLILARNANLC